MSTASRVAKNTMFLYGKMAITVGISLYTTRLILGALGAADFGIFNLVAGTIAMLGFLNASMAVATVRFMAYAEGAGDRALQREIFNVGFFIHLGLALLVGVVLYAAGHFFFNGFLKIPPGRLVAAHTVYYFMILSTMVTVMSVPYDAAINANEHFFLYAIVGVGQSLLTLSAALIVVHTMSDKLVTYGWLMASINVIVLATYRIYCHRKYDECRINYRLYFKKAVFREMFSFSGWQFLTLSVQMVSMYGMGIVLNRFFGALLNAAQGVAGQISGQLAAFSNTMIKALNPAIVKSEGAGDRQRMHRATMTGAKMSFFLNMMFFVPFIIEADYILSIWLKHVPQWSVIFTKLVLVQTLIEAFSTPLNSAINAEGHLKKVSLTRTMNYALLLPLIWLFFRLGYPPFAMWLVSIFIAATGLSILMYFAHKQCGITMWTYFLRTITPCLAVFAVTAGPALIPHLLMGTGLARLITVSFVFWSLFVIFVLYLGLDKQERRVIFRIVGNSLRRFNIKK